MGVQSLLEGFDDDDFDPHGLDVGPTLYNFNLILIRRRQTLRSLSILSHMWCKHEGGFRVVWFGWGG